MENENNNLLKYESIDNENNNEAFNELKKRNLMNNQVEAKQNVDVKPIQNNQPTNNGGVYIIDETSTTVSLESEDGEVTDFTNQTSAVIKQKKPSQKLNAWQIALIAVVSVIALWVAIFTVDHTLAANGISPVFCKQTNEYNDGSVSYTGLGYKVQFQFDENSNLTQKVLPVWKDGPNDLKYGS